MPRGRRGQKPHNKRTLSLDLHGHRHEQAREALISFIEGFYNSGRECVIITGNSPAMKLMTKKILAEYKMEYQEGDLLGNNNGYIKTWM